MKVFDIDSIEGKLMLPGFRAKLIHSSKMTFVHWQSEAGAVLPEHSHPHEQVVLVVEGNFQLSVDGETRILKPGSVAVIPPDALHSGKSITQCRLLDTFYPIREDLK